MKAQMERIDDSLFHIKNKMTLGQEADLRTDKVIITFSTQADKKNFE